MSEVSKIISSKNPKVIVVMPGRNVEKTIKKVFAEVPKDIVSEIILVDDGSRDKTAKVAKSLGIKVFSHPHNLGYGGAQKTGYWEALKQNPDVVALIHSDLQHDPSFLVKIVDPILKGKYDMMFGSRTTSRKKALSGGMPMWKYLISRFFTRIENLILGVNFSEHMCGFRAYSRKVLETVPFMRLSNDYVFDQEFMVSAVALGFKIGEIPIPTMYSEDSSSINLAKGIKFLFDICVTLLKFVLFKLNIYKDQIF